MTVTMPTMEELMVMGMAIISRFRRIVPAASGRSSVSWASRPRPVR